MLRIRTDRLELIAADLALIEADLADRARFSAMLGAQITPEWPPAILVDVIPVYRDLIRDQPTLAGWLLWYGVLRAAPSPVLVGSAGFIGPPDIAGMVEIGYSVVPGFQARGIAPEMVRALADWVFSHAGVAGIRAETADGNLGSRKVLERCGFRFSGKGNEPDTVLYCLLRPGLDR
ncbi:MAG: GNAT family N-acetyltransferase [Patescibacteria group bacterium]